MPLCKIGIIQYINSIFFWGPLVLKKIIPPFEVVLDTPAALNRKMMSGELQASMVSSATYLQNQNSLQLVSPFGISAKSHVLSVALFSPEPVDTLVDAPIAITEESATSVKLLEVLAKKYWGLNVHMQVVKKPTEHPIYLLIGDACLTHKTPTNYYKIDLAQQWHLFTGLPFTFGVFVEKTPIREWKEVMQEAYLYSQKHMGIIVDLAATKINLSKQEIEAYLNCLEFELREEHVESMRLFKEWSAEVSSGRLKDEQDNFLSREFSNVQGNALKYKSLGHRPR